ncbi:MAG: ATP-binding protein, partial [Candidatus Nanopelagicaceae bacterium]
MNIELQKTLETLKALAKDAPDNRPPCPAVDGVVPNDRLVEQVLKGQDVTTVNLLPNCKSECIRSENGLHFTVSNISDVSRSSARLCPCGKANQRLSSIKAMKLPVEASEKNHLNYDWMIEGHELVEKVEYFLKAISEGERKVLVLVGDPGTGKTHLLYAMAYLAAISQGGSMRVNYISQPHYLTQVKAGFDDPHKRVERVTGSRALFLDEIGYGRQTEWEKATINELLHHAWQSGQALVLATDIGWERLGSFLDRRIKDRLIEGTEGKRLVHHFTGKSQRSKGVQ